MIGGKDRTVRVETWEDLITIGTQVGSSKTCQNTTNIKKTYYLLFVPPITAATTEELATEDAATVADEVGQGGRVRDAASSAPRQHCHTGHHRKHAPEVESRRGRRGHACAGVSPTGSTDAHAPRHSQGQRTIQESPDGTDQQTRQV